MDEDIKNLLTEWDLQEYIPTFQDNKVSLKILPMLDAELAKDLITPVGDRAKFIKNLDNWKILTKNKNNPECSTPISAEFVDMLNESHRQILSVSEFFNIPNVNTQEGKEQDTQNQQDENHQIEQTEYKKTETGKSTPVLAMDTSMSEEHDSTSLLNPLKILLKQSHEGLGLLNLFEKDGKLSNNGRRKLCNIIVQDLLKDNPSLRIDGAVLLERAAQIKEVFKNENISTYFIPYMNNIKLKMKRCAKGKLYDCLQNRRRDLREAQVIGKRLSANQSTSHSSQQDDLGSSPNEEDILWLKNNSEPFHIVEEKWRKTAQHRLNEIKSSDVSIDNYMTMYPILKSPRGFELLKIDFEIMYPGFSNKLFENFTELKSKIFKIAISKPTTPQTKELIEQHQSLNSDDENYEESTNILALMLLPLLIGNPIHKGKKNSWRPSKAEVQDGFVTHIKRQMDLEDTITKRREKYGKYGLTFQPTVIIVGTNLLEIQKYYVVINNYYYCASSILDAVDICFKSFHTLHSHYSTESTCIWNFIQKGIYKIYTEWDKNYSTVNAFATDLGIEIR